MLMQQRKAQPRPLLAAKPAGVLLHAQAGCLPQTVSAGSCTEAEDGESAGAHQTK